MRSRVFGVMRVQRLLGREGEAVRLAHLRRHGGRAGELDHRAVDRKAGIGIDDLRPLRAEHQDRHEHGDLAARRDQDEVRRDVDAEPAGEVRRHGLAQGRDPGRVGIAVLAVAQRLDRRLDDVRRGFEVGLADAEVDDVAALALQFGGFGEHREGVLVAQARKCGIDGDHGAISPRTTPIWQGRGEGARACKSSGRRVRKRVGCCM